MLTTYENIRISPYNVQHIEELRIQHKINEHSLLFLTASLDDKEADKYVHDTNVGSSITITADNLDEEIIFKGTICNINVSHIGGIYQLTINGISNTIELDIKKKDRSFQDKKMPYTAIFNNIISEYYGGDIIDNATQGRSTGKFLMQYHETDWDLIRRFASHFNAVLVPYTKSENPKFFIGLPERKSQGQLEEFEYEISRNITDFRRSKENENKNLNNNDCTIYKVYTDKIMELGDQIQYKDTSLFICEANIEMKRSVIKNLYILTTRNGFSYDTYYNDQIIGLSVQGDVIETSTDMLKLHMCIDEHQNKPKAHFFKYSTMYTASGNSGFYCMPELGDVVFAYFPSNKEWEGITFNGARMNENKDDKLSDPDIKYMRTKYGKEIKFSPDEILITAVDDEIFIKINENTGIEMFSVKPIKFHTKENLSFEADKNIYMVAMDEINITCKTSKIKMDSNIIIQGLEVRHN